MATKFKGVDLDDGLARIVPYLATAEEYGGALQHLQSVWDNLSLLGQLSGTTTDMSATRVAFRELAEDLLNQLGREALRECLQDLGSRAQVAINILVRNLFERTADVGFLATDEDIRAFLRGRKAGGPFDLDALRRRFVAYVSKYSVYSDIIVLDPHGNVLARLDDTVEIATSTDPAIRAAIDTNAGYVEAFRATDLVAGRERALIYSFRVNDHDGSLLGVLCLGFRLDNEADLIFSNLVGREDWAVVTMLDPAGTVIASSDRHHIPLGVTFAPVLDAEYRIVRFGAMEYVAVSRVAQPYQNYAGPGWYGHVMIPLQHAFKADQAQTLNGIDPALIERLIQTSQLFNDQIRAIPLKAEHIQRELNRSIWNGNLKLGDSTHTGTKAFSKTLLQEVSGIGVRTKSVFQSSIADLNKTVVTSLLHDNQFHAALAIDIMDRNLYERANDCRWWALTSMFAELLSKPLLSDADRATIRAILRTINGLYTVYSNLIVFDRSGRIVAVSDAACTELEGTTLADEWVPRMLSLRGDQAYAVSDFVATPLYAGRPTYIYGAAIGDPQRKARAGGALGGALGGVAIIFDAAPQFVAMLLDALPRDGAGAVKDGAFGILADREGRVIACSGEQFRPGETLTIDPAFLRLSTGAGHSGITVFGAAYYAVGARASSGYREYKSEGGVYRNDVIALIFTRLCDVGARMAQAPAKSVSIRSDRADSGIKEDIATFFVGDRLFAVRVAEVVEAVEAAAITPLPLMPPGMAGCLIYDGKPLPVFDLSKLLRGHDAAPPRRASMQAVVMVSSRGERFGLLVDSLGEIAEVAESRVTFLPAMVTPQDALADAALAPDNDSEELIVVLRADQIYANVVIRAPVTAAA